MMKFRFGTRKITFMVLRDANASVVRFRLRSIYLILLPLLILISGVVAGVTIYKLSNLYKESILLNAHLEAKLQEEYSEHKAIVESKDEIIEQLMTDVVELTMQTELVQERLVELQQLTDQIRMINGELEESDSGVLFSQSDRQDSNRQDVMIASAHSVSTFSGYDTTGSSYDSAMQSMQMFSASFANDFNSFAEHGEHWHLLSASEPASMEGIISIFDGLLLGTRHYFELENGQGGLLHEVTPSEIIALADDTMGNLKELEQWTGVLKEDLEEARELAIEYQHLLRITPSIWPTKSTRITSSFGYRKDPFTRRLSHHSGIDFGGKTGDPVYATADGKVINSSFDRYLGHHVIIDHSNGIRTLYAHLSKRLVSVGDNVEKGEEIGKLGSTGRSTGPHLHYEVYKNGVPVNPKNYLP